MTLIDMQRELTACKGQRKLIKVWAKRDLPARRRYLTEINKLINHYEECLQNGDYEDKKIHEERR